MNAPSTVIHGGSGAGYSRGCRCDDCKAAHAARMRAYYARNPRVRTDAEKTDLAERRKTRLNRGLPNPDDSRHGTATGYRDYGCRCDRCKAAERAYRTERKSCC